MNIIFNGIVPIQNFLCDKGKSRVVYEDLILIISGQAEYLKKSHTLREHLQAYLSIQQHLATVEIEMAT